MKHSLFFSLFAFLIFTGCSDVSMVSHQRDESFYARLHNPGAEAPQAESKIAELKMIETGEEYPMRLVLFDNNQFYYQVDKLGNGTGTWKYNKGSIEFTAKRPIFDLNIVLSASKAEGDGMVLRFIDRFGINTIETWMRDPELLKKVKDQSTTKLREFTRSTKNI